MKKLFTLLLPFLLMTGCLGAVQDVNVTIQEQPTALMGDTYDLVVTITNHGSEDRLLTSIDIGDDYLEGVTLIGSSPAWTGEWDFGFMGFQSYDYQINLPADESIAVSFTFQAATAGNYEGSLDVCIDTESDCIYNTIFTSIQ